VCALSALCALSPPSSPGAGDYDEGCTVSGQKKRKKRKKRQKVLLFDWESPGKAVQGVERTGRVGLAQSQDRPL
jgi:hypothetical protein